MKQFNVEEYLKKHRRDVVTRDGRKARILCCDLKNDTYTVVAAIKDGEIEVPLTYTEQGKAILGRDSSSDLFFAPEKHEGWINIFKNSNDLAFLGQSRIFASKEDAKKDGKDCECYVATVKVEWEE